MHSDERAVSPHRDERAVSPVVAVVLLVAVVVVLGGVAAVFFLGAGEEPVEKPTVEFDVKYEREVIGDDQLVLRHVGGDPLDPTRMNATMNGTTNTLAALGASDPFTAGDSVTLNATTGGGYNSHMTGDTLSVVWYNPEEDDSFVLFEHDVGG